MDYSWLVHWSDVKQGKKLGEGAYATVYEGRTTFKDLLYLLKRCRSVEEAKGRNKEAKTSNFRHRK